MTSEVDGLAIFYNEFSQFCKIRYGVGGAFLWEKSWSWSSFRIPMKVPTIFCRSIEKINRLEAEWNFWVPPDWNNFQHYQHWLDVDIFLTQAKICEYVFPKTWVQASIINIKDSLIFPQRRLRLGWSDSWNFVNRFMKYWEIGCLKLAIFHNNIFGSGHLLVVFPFQVWELRTFKPMIYEGRSYFSCLTYIKSIQEERRFSPIEGIKLELNYPTKWYLI